MIGKLKPNSRGLGSADQCRTVKDAVGTSGWRQDIVGQRVQSYSVVVQHDYQP